jgi:hypothetical protein
MGELRKSAGECALDLRERLANLPFLIVQGQELPFDRIVQLTQISTSHSTPNRDQHLRTDFDQYTFIYGEIDRLLPV